MTTTGQTEKELNEEWQKTECFMELGETHMHGNSVEIKLIILSAMHPAKKNIIRYMEP